MEDINMTLLASNKMLHKMDIFKIIKIISLWSHEMTTTKNLQRECGIGLKHTVTDWRKFMRDICQHFFLRNPRQMESPKHDGFLFKRRKHNIGRSPKALWIFGQYNPIKKEGSLMLVPNYNDEPLLLIIKTCILLLRTMVVSGCWKGNSKVGEVFHDLTVNYNLNYVDHMMKASQKNSLKEISFPLPVSFPTKNTIGLWICRGFLRKKS